MRSSEQMPGATSVFLNGLRPVGSLRIRSVLESVPYALEGKSVYSAAGV